MRPHGNGKPALWDAWMQEQREALAPGMAHTQPEKQLLGKHSERLSVACRQQARPTSQAGLWHSLHSCPGSRRRSMDGEHKVWGLFKGSKLPAPAASLATEAPARGNGQRPTAGRANLTLLEAASAASAWMREPRTQGTSALGKSGVPSLCQQGQRWGCSAPHKGRLSRLNPS